MCINDPIKNFNIFDPTQMFQRLDSALVIKAYFVAIVSDVIPSIQGWATFKGWNNAVRAVENDSAPQSDVKKIKNGVDSKLVYRKVPTIINYIPSDKTIYQMRLPHVTSA